MDYVNTEYTNSEGTRVIVLGQNATVVQVFYQQANKAAQKIEMDLQAFAHKIKTGALVYVKKGNYVTRSSI